MEKVNFLLNGQWQLEKGVARKKAPFNAEPNMARTLWTLNEDQDEREKIPKISKEGAFRVGNKLMSMTQARLNPATKEREYLLHRGMGPGEHHDRTTGNADESLSSWTPNKDFADEMANKYSGHNVSAWIPESMIHNATFMFNPKKELEGDASKLKELSNKEHEIIVAPHSFNIHSVEHSPAYKAKYLKKNDDLNKWDSKNRQKAVDWAEGGMRENLNTLPEAKGSLRNKMIEDLQQDVSSNPKIKMNMRVNPDTNKKEYLLHRAKHKDDKLHEKELTSWTIHPDFTDYWANNVDDSDVNNMRTASAWFPEDMIHSYLPTVTRTDGGKDFGYEDYKDEGEVLVHPHSGDVHQISTPDIKSVTGKYRP